MRAFVPRAAGLGAGGAGRKPDTARGNRMQNLRAADKLTRENSLRADDVRRRVAECRGRLRKGRAARRIAVCAAPDMTAPFGARADSSRAAARRGKPPEAA
jgi:hypothetical protein